MPPLPNRISPLDGLPGPARPIGDAQARALVRGALKRVIAGDHESAVARQPRLGRSARAAIIIVGCLFGGAALAALTLAPRWSSFSLRGPATTGPAAPALAPTVPVPGTVDSDDLLGTAPAEDPIANPPTTALPAPGRRTSTTRARGSAHPTATALRETRDDHPVVPTVGRNPEDVLSLANQLRGERRWHEAAAAYQKIVATFPSTPTAYVATLARAELLLDHLDRPREALQLFQRALARDPGGLLTEEARYGIAACYRAMGDRDNERRALGLFLATQPHSLMRASVEARLAELR